MNWTEMWYRDKVNRVQKLPNILFLFKMLGAKPILKAKYICSLWNIEIDLTHTHSTNGIQLCYSSAGLSHTLECMMATQIWLNKPTDSVSYSLCVNVLEEI